MCHALIGLAGPQLATEPSDRTKRSDTEMSELVERYSGPKSRKFWKHINSVKSEPERAMLYIAGCGLQDHESRMFQMLAEVAAKKKPPK
jgi:hypothetical protein